MTPAERESFLDEVSSAGSIMNLDAMRRLMDKLGHPERAARYVHIAGTNGKGSVLAYLRSILKASGLSCGYYFSPAVMKAGEQTGVGGRRPGKKRYEGYLEEIRKASLEMKAEGGRFPSMFEVETACAFMYFRDMKCDIAVVECGMGGRDDATNVIPAPEVAVFTPISKDHVNILGRSLKEIAGVKSGIIKKGCTVVSAPQAAEVSEVLGRVSREQGCDLHFASQPQAVKYSLKNQSFSYRGFKGLKTGMCGVFQPANAAVALEAVYALRERGYDISEKAVTEGLMAAVWPGRFDILKRSPYVIMDGAHNEAGAEALEASLKQYFPEDKFIGVAGVLRDKDYKKVMDIILPHIDCFIALTPPENPRALPAMELAEYVGSSCPNVTVADSVEEAYEMAQLMAGGKKNILAFGSLSWLGRWNDAAAQADKKGMGKW